MAAEEDLILDEVDSDSDKKYELLSIINNQIDALHCFNDMGLTTPDEIAFDKLYDKGMEHRIKCVSGFLEVINAAQQALLEQIKTL